MTNTSCPKCGRDIWQEYEDYQENGESKYIKIENLNPFFDGGYSGYTWDVTCIVHDARKDFGLVTLMYKWRMRMDEF